MPVSKRTPSQSDSIIQDASPHQDVLVLHTKMCKPPVRGRMVLRQSIIDRLESNLALPLSLISANTGCGKSIAISQWLDQTRHKFGWLSLDDEHNNTEVLLAYFIAIFKEQWPGKSFGIEYLRDAAKLPATLIASTLIKDLDDLDDPFILVLDDYHRIREDKIHEIINGLLRYPPEQFHLVIITQIDPPLKLAKFRAQFRLCELRMHDLAFTAEEALELRSIITADTPDDQVLELLGNAEGWATGLTAGLMGLADGIPMEKVAEVLLNRGSIISDLLDEVVLTGLPDRTVRYLELTALLDRFSENLLKAMIDAIQDPELRQLSTGELIRNSRRRNLFLIPLDSSGEWYRYHHFFKNQVEHLIGKNYHPEELEKLYKAASRWFEEQELLEEALAYALRSKDLDFAIGLFSRFRHKLLNREQLQRLYRLTHQFPADVRNNSPELLINLAMLQHYDANFSGMQHYLSRAETLLKGLTGRSENETELIGEYHSVCTYLSYMQGDFEKAIDHGEKSMGLLPAAAPNFYRELAVGWYAFAQQASGHALAGMDKLESEYQTLANAESYFQMRLLQGKLIFYLFDGQTTHLYQDGASLTDICSPKGYPGSWGIGLYGMAYHSYVYNHLEKVSLFHDELRKYRFASRPFWVMHHFLIECLSGMAGASWQKVEHCIGQCKELAEELAIEPLKGMVKAFQVEYYLRRGDVGRAREVAAIADFEPHPPVFFYFIPQLTRVKLLLQTQQEDKGQELLQDLLEMGRARHNKNLLTQALALQAAIYSEQGNTPSAVNSLQELLTLTKDSGNIRVFLDQGPVMENLLLELEKANSNKEQVTRLLKAFKQEKETLPSGRKNLNNTRRTTKVKLSVRESEILALVTQGFKNEEIATKLFISLDTVKKHLYRAYQKLDVTNRVSAIQKVQTLGLITAE